MKVFTLTVEERSHCYYAVNLGGGERGGYKVDETLNKAEPILIAITEGAERDDKMIKFSTCDEKKEISLENHVMNFLVQSLRNAKWETAEKALNVRKLIHSLEGLPVVPDKEEKAEVEKK